MATTTPPIFDALARAGAKLLNEIGGSIDNSCFPQLVATQAMLLSPSVRPTRRSVTVTTGVSRIGSTSFDISGTLLDENGKAAATCTSVLVFVDVTTAKPVEIPDSYLSRLEEFSNG